MKIRIPHHLPDAPARIAAALRPLLAGRETVVLCIGTDRVMGDALGPVVGSELRQMGVPRVYGTLDEPVHAENLAQVLADIRAAHPGAAILAVDAALGKAEHVGTVAIGQGAVQPGKGVGRSDLPSVGDAHVTGVVDLGGFFEMLVLRHTRLGIVLAMARVIARGIALALAEEVVPGEAVAEVAVGVEA